MATCFMKNQFKSIVSLDRMYSLPVCVLCSNFAEKKQEIFLFEKY